ncbi:MAG: SIMPL domain-containing protein, partial [Flavobacteriales bacterium]
MKNVFATLTLLIGIFVSAQQIQQKSFIEVSSEAQEKVTPDEIYLGISLKESDSKGRISIEKQEEDLKRALISLGIDVK